MILLLNKNCRPLQKISPSPLRELRLFTVYLKSTNLTTKFDPLSLLAVVPPNLFPAIQTKLWHLPSKLYHHPWPRQTSFHYGHYISLYCQKTKVSWSSKIFSINTLLRNLALKHYTAASIRNKLMAQPWVPKWGPAASIFSQVLSNTNFSVNAKAQT